jgi:hypothetical protein
VIRLYRSGPGQYGWSVCNDSNGLSRHGLTRWEARQWLGFMGIEYTEEDTTFRAELAAAAEVVATGDVDQIVKFIGRDNKARAAAAVALNEAST